MKDPAQTDNQGIRKMPNIQFKSKLFQISQWTILRLPEDASIMLPSRGQTMVKGTINGSDFQAPLEPDGKWSHWLHVDKTMQKTMNVKAGDSVKVVVEPVKEWPEPDIPTDIQKALVANRQARNLWEKITPMARWEWVRWIRATNNQETRKHRIEVAMSKLTGGERRPCCWNRAACSEPAVSKGGVLLEPVS